MSRGEVKTAAHWRERVANHVLPVGAFYFFRRSAVTTRYSPSRRKNVRHLLRGSNPIRQAIAVYMFLLQSLLDKNQECSPCSPYILVEFQYSCQRSPPLSLVSFTQCDTLFLSRNPLTPHSYASRTSHIRRGYNSRNELLPGPNRRSDSRSTSPTRPALYRQIMVYVASVCSRVHIGLSASTRGTSNIPNTLHPNF